MSAGRAALLAALVPVVSLVSLVAVPAAGAQSRMRSVTTTLEAGGSQVRWADSLRSSAATLTPAVGIEWDRTTVGLAGTVSSFASGWSTQGSVAASRFTRPRGAWTGELALASGGSAHEDGTRTALSLATARAHLMAPARGAWAGAGLGTSWDGGWRAVRVAEVGAWTQARTVTALASVTPTDVGGDVRYADTELALRWARARLELGLTGGVRAGDALPGTDDRRQWGSVTATGWLTRRLALVASGGTYPVDFTQGFPGGRFVSVALRVGGRAPAPATRQAAGSAAAELAPAIEATRSRGGRATLRVRVPGARRVEVTGDFTNWTPVALVAGADGWWSVTLPIAPGTHELNVRVDGGPWRVPAGLTPVSQEFGAPVGLLVVT